MGSTTLKIRTNRARLAATAIAVAMMATACAADPAETPSGDPSADDATPTDEMTTDASALGEVVIPAGEKIQIRSLEAISGDVAFLGVPNQRGTELAIADFGAIEGFEVDLGTPLDDLCDSAGGQAAAQTIVSDEQVVGVIGTSCSGAAVAAMPLISQAGLVMISASNTSPSLTSDLAGNAGSDYQPGYFRTAHNDLFQGRAVAEFVFTEKGLQTAAAIHDGDPYTQGLAQAFADAFTALGGTVTTVTAVNKGDTDMTGVLTEVAADSPEALFFPIFMPEGGLIAQQIGGVEGLNDTMLLSADGLLTDNFIELAETVGVFHSGPNLDYAGNASVTGVSGDDFLAAYQEAYGEAPSAPFWAHSYDATALLLTAITNVATIDDDGAMHIDRQALRDELTSTTGFAGIIGTISCDAFGDCGAQRISVVEHDSADQVTAGDLTSVFEYEPAA
jgi:branched-chain amino acid transport system substrate-binding protein